MGNKTNRRKKPLKSVIRERAKMKNAIMRQRRAQKSCVMSTQDEKSVETPTKLHKFPHENFGDELCMENEKVQFQNKLSARVEARPVVEEVSLENFEDVIVDSDGENIPPENIIQNKHKSHELCPYEVLSYGSDECTYLEGRRIVDIQNFFNVLKEISIHKSLFDCGLSTIEIVSEQKKGLFSLINLQCLMCKKKFQVKTTNQNINKDAVSGITASGGGFAQLKQFTAAIDVPNMSESNYLKVQDIVADEWERTAWAEMIKAGKMEREIAINEGRTNKEGIAMIDVIVDGCWSRRSYQSHYAASSGCAAIIGRRTGKVLYMSVKNKYCSVCQKSDQPKSHKCYKNFDGPSTGMEAAIIVEGFKNSIEMHNLIYSRFIADGDSSTYCKILEARPYPNITVEKLNCRNHILRRFCNHFQNLIVDTRYPVKDRKLITKGKILASRKYIYDAIKLHKVSKNYEKLHTDISNSVCHAFGMHEKCNAELCCSTDDKITQFSTTTLWQRIKTIAANVASHTRSLIEDVDSNVVEQFNGVIAKMVGGKRVNYSQRRSYQMRCAGAVVSFNSRSLLSTVHRNVHKNTPKKSLKLFEARLNTKLQRNNLKLRKKRRTFVKKTSIDTNYGQNAEQPDMDDETFEMSKKKFLENLMLPDAERERITLTTKLQGECGEWLEIRRNLLTASNFGKVAKRKRTHTCQTIVQNMLYKRPLDHVSSIQHGQKHEAIALEQLAKLKNIKIQKCGLYIDETYSFLGATPDGITDDMVVEIKCPVAPFKTGNIEEAIGQNKMHFWKKDKNGLVYINKKSDWFYQAQGQMHITKKTKCLFAVWYGDDKLKTEILAKDDEFWEKEMYPKLKEFYMDCLLPELVDPRHLKGKPIRNPPYVTSFGRKTAVTAKTLSAGPTTTDLSLENSVVDQDFALSPATTDLSLENSVVNQVGASSPEKTVLAAVFDNEFSARTTNRMLDFSEL